MTTIGDQLLVEVAGTFAFPSDKHMIALRLCCEQWGYELAEQPYHGRDSLKSRVKQAYWAQARDNGSMIIAAWLLLVIAAAAIEWAVQRFLDWMYPEGEIDHERAQRLMKCQQGGL